MPCGKQFLKLYSFIETFMATEVLVVGPCCNLGSGNTLVLDGCTPPERPGAQFEGYS